jgi:hypothetical protein
VQRFICGEFVSEVCKLNVGRGLESVAKFWISHRKHKLLSVLTSATLIIVYLETKKWYTML